MPGLVGIITQMPRGLAEAELRRMLGTMQHEPTYSMGTWADQPMGIYLGWALRQNSFSDHLPIKNENGNVTLAFSGEEFPDPGIKRSLKSRGHDVPEGGAHYLAHLYEEDEAFPANLNGIFQGFVIDRDRKRATLFNDRYGMHRVYYHQSSEAFYFAAEAKALLAVRPELRSLNAQNLGEFLTCGCVLENRTFFNGIEILPPGSAWSFENGKLKERDFYFMPEEWEQLENLGPEEYYQELQQVFSRNLPRYFSGSERVGLSLTGGLDTRMIMAWWKCPPNSLPCYTFGGSLRDCQDVVIAREVAKVCKQPYQLIPVGEDFLAQFPTLAERTVYLSDGCADVGRSPDLYANRIASQIAPVRMTGNYGSEILRRLRAFKPVDPTPGLFANDMLPYFSVAKDTFGRCVSGHAVSFTAFRQAPWYQHGLLSVERTQLSLRSPYLDNDLVRTAFRAPNSSIVKSDIFEDNDACVRLIADGSPELRRIPTDRGLGGASWHSRAWLEFSFKAEYAYDYGMPQWLARADHFLSPLKLERMILGRHKFYHFRIWYRDQLSKYVREMLLDPKTLSRPYINASTLEMMVSSHLKGNRNYTVAIHKVLTLELIHRLFLDSGALA